MGQTEKSQYAQMSSPLQPIADIALAVMLKAPSLAMLRAPSLDTQLLSLVQQKFEPKPTLISSCASGGSFF